MEERNQPRRPRRDAEQPQQKSESLIYGKNPVTELLKSGSGVDTVLIAEGMAPLFCQGKKFSTKNVYTFRKQPMIFPQVENPVESV